MNPHAKEFVPAHLMKRRQEEDELVDKVGQVGLEDSESGPDDKKSGAVGGDTTTNNSVIDNNATKSHDTDQSQEPQHNYSNNAKSTSNHPNNNHQHHSNTNGEKQDLEAEDDRLLLKAGETFCEFNGEQFIIPGDDGEYEADHQDYGLKAGYDFGNAEDNEDEDVYDAYEQFLDNLPG